MLYNMNLSPTAYLEQIYKNHAKCPLWNLIPCKRWKPQCFASRIEKIKYQWLRKHENGD
jgi:hypothetical protein